MSRTGFALVPLEPAEWLALLALCEAHLPAGHHLTRKLEQIHQRAREAAPTATPTPTPDDDMEGNPR